MTRPRRCGPSWRRFLAVEDAGDAPAASLLEQLESLLDEVIALREAERVQAADALHRGTGGVPVTPPLRRKQATMSHADLAKQVTVLLAELLSGTLSGRAEEAADRLFDLVSGRLARAGQTEAVRDFRQHPASTANRDALTQCVARELTNDVFHREVTACLDQSVTTSGGFRQTSGRDSYGAGRDLSVDRSRRTSKTSFGGLPVAAVAIVALIALGLGAKVVFGGSGTQTGTSLDADSTCTEFLRADPATQMAVVKELYLAAGHADRAGDPFILQNATYACGSSPNMKLRTLAH
ncbi:hypothetical protein AB0F15_10055 [Amycolatopsis sp. NPDC026612]|uniref:hypothetical protein n=1 Tax=Amycolatopsis sp. NPDC026612 TaxID=3155466 RepID=UPI003410EA6A